MLIRFAASNHKSIKEPVELSLVAVDQERLGVRHFERVPQGILTLAAIYGPNASGKSNVLHAISWLSSAVRSSLRLWEDEIPREPFRFSGYPELPSAFELEFVHGGVRHAYSLHLDDHSVIFEELLSYPERKPRQLFVREGLNLHFRRGLTGVSALKSLLTPATLALSLARRLELPELRDPAMYISSIASPFMRRRPLRGGGGGVPRGFSINTSSLANSTSRMFIDNYKASLREDQNETLFRTVPEADLDSARALLRFADLGIEDVEVQEGVDEFSNSSRLDLRLIHRAGNEEIPFELGEESDGTQMWFRLLGPALAALRNGRPLLLDEIDASLHPLLSARMLDLFRDPSVNKNDAQIIFTTHDTTLLGELNRDEVWFTEKGRDGATKLTGLAEFGGDRVRKSLNLERAYLQGRFGGIPRITESQLGAVSLFDDDDVENSNLETDTTGES
jgi:uncharacterized protein